MPKQKLKYLFTRKVKKIVKLCWTNMEFSLDSAYEFIIDVLAQC